MPTQREFHLPLVARTATGNLPFTGGFEECHFIVGALRCTAASGTTPTLDVSIQTSIDATNWDTVMTFTQLTAAGAERKFATDLTTGTGFTFWGEQMRILWTITGTTPSFTFMVDLYGKE